jgi:hypothetical protein
MEGGVIKRTLKKQCNDADWIHLARNFGQDEKGQRSFGSGKKRGIISTAE